MKWTVKLVAEVQPGALVEQEVITVERNEDLVSPATVGLTIAEGKAIMESLQRQIVATRPRFLRNCLHRIPTIPEPRTTLFTPMIGLS